MIAPYGAWISQGDAFLAIDSNGNGRIDDRNELFGGEVGEGFAKLASFDSNGDGIVDKNDARFNGLRLWQDRDSDHQTDAGELISLTEAQIASLSVRYTIRAEHQNGNWVLERSHATMADGRAIDMADAYFQVETSPTQSPQVANQPNQTSGLVPLIAGMNNNVTAKSVASITVQSVLPSAKGGDLPRPGRAQHEFAQRPSEQSIRLTNRLATRSEWDEQDETNDSNWRTDTRPTVSDAKPLIDWD